ncbi:MAG TPA: hypothetical protein VND19_20295 [Acetobacteraceae bacterium]|nr:hypothetical protein [Acetobacteraceae bacterium]
MSDTVPSAVIVSSLASDGPTFLALPDAPETAESGAVHVRGGAYAERMSFALIVDFRTLSPDWQVATPRAYPAELPASVSGYAGLMPEDPPRGIPGALHLT